MSTLSVFQSFKPVANSGDDQLIKSSGGDDTVAYCEAYFKGPQGLHAYSEDEVCDCHTVCYRFAPFAVERISCKVKLRFALE